MTLSNITTLSSFTDNAPASPAYMNAKWSEVNANFQNIAATTQRTLGWFNVKDYGAVGDGTTDDTAAIQAALNAVPDAAVAASLYTTRGGTVYLPAGVYRVTSTLTMIRGTTVLGEGSEATILQYEATTGDVLYYQRPDSAMSTQPPITVRGIRITIKSGVTHTSGAGLRIDSADTTPNKGDRCNLEDVYVYAAYEGFRIRNMLGGQIRFCEAHSCGASGFVFRGFCTLLQVSNCWSSANTSHGWDISGWSYCNVTACGSDSNTGYGWYVKKQSGDGTMYGNTFTSIGSEGSVAGLFLFDTLLATTVTCFGIPKLSGGTTADGVTITACTGLVITPHLLTETTATGYSFKITDPTVSTGIVQLGGFVGFYAAGANQYTGAEHLTIIAYQSSANIGATTSLGGQTATTGANGTGAALAAVRRTGTTGTAGKVIADYRPITTDNQGSAVLRVGADNGTSFAQIEHNSSVGAPYTYGSFGDGVVRSTAGRLIWVSSAQTLSVGSTDWVQWQVPSIATFGSALIPSMAFSSETSLGMYRSGVSTIAPSYGTFNLASNSVRLSVRSLAMASLTSANVAVNEICFAVGASGCSLAFRSGGTMWYPNSSLSTKG